MPSPKRQQLSFYIFPILTALSQWVPLSPFFWNMAQEEAQEGRSIRDTQLFSAVSSEFIPSGS